MRTLHTPSPRQHRHAEIATGMMQKPALGTLQSQAAAAVQDALDALIRTAAGPSFASPGALSEDAITDYALALIHLRERACAAGYERLTNACDALAVTVSRLIDDPRAACPEKCAALTRFVVHAQAMIPAPEGRAPQHVLPFRESPIGSGRIQIGRRARGAK